MIVFGFMKYYLKQGDEVFLRNELFFKNCVNYGSVKLK